MRNLLTLLAFINSFSIVFAQDTLKIGKFEVINLDSLGNTNLSNELKESLITRQNNIQTVIHILNHSGLTGYRYVWVKKSFVSNAVTPKIENDLKTVYTLLKNQKNIDWLQDDNQTLDKPTFYKLSVYKYIVQTKKRVLLCQLVFDFFDENHRELISDFHFIAKSQIENLQEVENRINKKY
jgi:hypothetical protein